jgi:hypothetical protein
VPRVRGISAARRIGLRRAAVLDHVAAVSLPAEAVGSALVDVLCDKAVSEPAHGFESRRIGRITLDLLP